MEYKGYTSTQFADTVEVPRAVISHIISGRNKPSLDVIIRIVSAFPEVSKEWILLGDGDMLKDLATNDAPAFPAKPSVEAPVKGKEEVPADMPKPEKVPLPSSHDIPVKAPEQTGKSIEQIVIFYTDKTFMAYKP